MGLDRVRPDPDLGGHSDREPLVDHLSSEADLAHVERVLSGAANRVAERCGDDPQQRSTPERLSNSPC